MELFFRHFDVLDRHRGRHDQIVIYESQELVELARVLFLSIILKEELETAT